MTMEFVLDLPPDLPQHTATPLSIVPHDVVASWRVGTFVENLVVLDDGDIVVSVRSEKRLDRIRPATRERSPFATLSFPPTGLVATRDTLYVAGGEPGVSPGQLWRVRGGVAEPVLDVADAVLNGLTPLTSDVLLATDGLHGRLCRLDLATGGTQAWFQHMLLTKVTAFPPMPGANGLKLFGGHAYITNTDRALLLRVAIKLDGTAGALEVVAEGLRGDDFAFDRQGACYIASAVQNSLVRLTQAGERIALAGPDQGMPGATAVAFGRTAADRTSLYVTTTGGLIAPYQRYAQAAKLIRLEVGVEGHDLRRP